MKVDLIEKFLNHTSYFKIVKKVLRSFFFNLRPNENWEHAMTVYLPVLKILDSSLDNEERVLCRTLIQKSTSARDLLHALASAQASSK